MERRQFHTFDALRFFACFKVFLSHLPILAFDWFNFLKAGGGIGVQFFFVLSGFLISYILMIEKENTQKINLRNFFKRRILRIWPLFYLMIAFAFASSILLKFIGNSHAIDEGYEPNWGMSLLFLENYKMMETDAFPNYSPLRVMWSLCIEEHFYILWGIVFYYCRKNYVLHFILSCLFIGLFFRIFYHYLDIPNLDVFSNIDLFAYGAIPAYLLIYKKEWVQRFNNQIGLAAKLMFVAILVLLVTVLPNMDWIPVFGIVFPTLWGILFSTLLLFILPEKTRFKISDKSIFSKLGIYTYGFYLYHTIVINATFLLFRKLNYNLDLPIFAIIFFCLTLVVSLLCSKLSYDYFEKPFLRLKTKI